MQRRRPQPPFIHHFRRARTPTDHDQLLEQRAELIARAHEIADAQEQLAFEMADVRTRLAEQRVIMWPRVERADLVRGFRLVRRNGPPPIPPPVRNATPLRGKQLRLAALVVLSRATGDVSLTEIRRELHLDGYTIDSRAPVKRLADALGYEDRLGRAVRTRRGWYRLGVLSPGTRRRLDRFERAVKATA
ncbi:MAG TPA: hypothetical protein VFR41_03025 [Acidimicrobiia bacterium]|nr:hypothetical protein [Acidimicrobiia bacterium]